MAETTCAQNSDEHLRQAVAGHLQEADYAALTEHLEGCANCRKRLDHLLQHDTLLGSTLREESALGLPALNQEEYSRLKASAMLALQTARQRADLPPKIGRYRVIRLLNTGGTSRVYECMDERLHRRVAIKVLHEFSNDTRSLHRLRREAKLQAALRHPNVVQVLEVESDTSPPYIVMELMEGGTVKDLKRAGPLPPRNAALIVARVARAVHEAHALGFLHRDIKPSNILIEQPFDIINQPIEALRVKVGDFGLARAFDSASDLTKPEVIVGTPAYMSPEQTQRGDQPLGPASDIYALGVLLYELIVGRPPLVADHFGLTLAMIREVEPIAPRSIQPNVSKDLNTICMKCLEKAPERRYATALALAEDLENYQQGKPIQARPVSELAQAWRWCRRNRLVASSLAFAMISLVAMALGSIWFAIIQKRLKNEVEIYREREKVETRKVIHNYKLLNEQNIGIQQQYFAELQNSIAQFDTLMQIPKTKLTPESLADLNRLNRKKWLNSAKEIYAQLENEFSQPEFTLQLACFIAKNLDEQAPGDEKALWQSRVKKLALNYPPSAKINDRTLDLIYSATLKICRGQATTRAETKERAELAAEVHELFKPNRLTKPASLETSQLYAQLGELAKHLPSEPAQPTADQ